MRVCSEITSCVGGSRSFFSFVQANTLICETKSAEKLSLTVTENLILAFQFKSPYFNYPTLDPTNLLDKIRSQKTFQQNKNLFLNVNRPIKITLTHICRRTKINLIGIWYRIVFLSFVNWITLILVLPQKITIYDLKIWLGF